MSEQNHPRLEERYSASFTRTMAMSLLWMVACAVIILVLGAENLAGEVMGGAKVVIIIGVAAALTLLVRSLVCKVRLDEGGVEVDNPLLGRSAFRWEELHTAAIVDFAVQKQNAKAILLSTREPQEVLTPAAFQRRADKREQVRIPYTEKRREIVEHYLRMTLPEISL